MRDRFISVSLRFLMSRHREEIAARHNFFAPNSEAASGNNRSIAIGLPQATELNVQDRVISFNYGRIEGEPSFPMGNFGGTNAYEGGAAPGHEQLVKLIA